MRWFASSSLLTLAVTIIILHGRASSSGARTESGHGQTFQLAKPYPPANAWKSRSSWRKPRPLVDICPDPYCSTVQFPLTHPDPNVPFGGSNLEKLGEIRASFRAADIQFPRPPELVFVERFQDDAAPDNFVDLQGVHYGSSVGSKWSANDGRNFIVDAAALSLRPGAGRLIGEPMLFSNMSYYCQARNAGYVGFPESWSGRKPKHLNPDLVWEMHGGGFTRLGTMLNAETAQMNLFAVFYPPADFDLDDPNTSASEQRFANLVKSAPIVLVAHMTGGQGFSSTTSTFNIGLQTLTYGIYRFTDATSQEDICQFFPVPVGGNGYMTCEKYLAASRRPYMESDEAGR